MFHFLLSDLGNQNKRRPLRGVNHTPLAADKKNSNKKSRASKSKFLGSAKKNISILYQHILTLIIFVLDSIRFDLLN